MMENLRKLVVIFLCMGFCNVAYSLTSGPMQPEFTSFEPVDVTDLVNMPTGDFTYVLPLGEVKSPEGIGYPITLSYHAGIANEQEATWVGLGWTLNPGAINRQVVGFPDDYFQAENTSYLANQGANGSQTSLGLGWSGYTINLGWTNKGFQGITGVGFSYAGLSFGINSNSVQVGYNGMNVSVGQNGFGVSAGIGNGITVGENFSYGKGQAPVFGGSIGMCGADFSLNSTGQGNVGLGGSSASISSTSFNNNGMHSSSNSEGFSLVGPYGISLSYSNYSWGWYYQQMQVCKSFGYIYHSPKQIFNVETYFPLLPYFSQEAEYNNSWGYSKVPETMTGLKKATTADGITGSPARQTLPPVDNPYIDVEESGDRLEYVKCCGMNLPSQDIYSVTGQGISGVFKPIANKALTTMCSPYDPTKDGLFYVNYNSTPPIACNTSSPYVSPFLNSGLVFKMISENAMNLIDDPDIGTDSYSSNNLGNIHTMPDGPGRIGGTQITPIFGTEKGNMLLEGFIITDLDGKSYYYTIALKNLQQVTLSTPTPAIPAQISSLQAPTNSYSYSYNNQAFATTWLLTAITGPDYIKLSGNYLNINPSTGTPQSVTSDAVLPREGDWGYWVKFSYQYDSDNPKATMLWRNPYNDFITNEQTNPPQYTTVFGQKEITYLSAIETPTEIAYFRTQNRADGQGLSVSQYPNVLQPITQIQTTATCMQLQEYASSHLPLQDQEGRVKINDLQEGKKIYVITGQSTVVLKNTSRAWFDGLQDGDPMMVMNIKGTATFRACGIDAIWCWGSHAADATGGFTVIKNLNGKQTFPVTNRYCRDDGSLIYSLTNYVSCTAVSVSGQDLVLTITPVNSGPLFTGGCLSAPESSDGCGCYDVSGVQVTSFVLANAAFLNNTNTITSTLKSLNEIAWYSKSMYPFIKSEVDPESPGYSDICTSNNLPIPKAYHKVKFDYNYELAPNTPNSTAANQGRLTLKAVTLCGGADASEVTMPPFLFTYQNSSVPYLGPQYADPWGYRKPVINGPQDVPDQGVNWNLSRIDLPSGGSIGMEYERDNANSSFATVYKIKCDNPNRASSEILPQPSSSYYDVYNFVTYNSGTKQLTLDRTDGLEPGRCFIAYCGYDTKTDPQQYSCFGQQRTWNLTSTNNKYFYLFRIKQVISSTVVALEQGLPNDAIPTQGFSASIYALKDQQIYCDGIRVKKIIANSGGQVLTTQYTYPVSGVIKLLPSEAIPLNFQNDYDDYQGSTGGCSSDAASGSCSCQDGNSHNFQRTISYQPFSTDMEKNYNDGNTMVLYPEVDVVQLDQSNNVVNGTKKYYFWTYYDEVVPGSLPVEIVNGLATNNKLSINQIWDRSGIIGLLKGVEYYSKTNTAVPMYKKANTYAFSENLASSAGVIFGDLGNNQVDATPLGMIRQRSKQIDPTGTIVNIADLIISKPFLIETSETKDNVTINTKMGMFDAYTGAPTVTMTTNSDSKEKIEVDIPISYTAMGSDKEALVEKNIFSVNSGKAVLDATDLGITDPKNVSYSTLFQNLGDIKSATAQTFTNEPFPVSSSNVPFDQFRYDQWQTFSWNYVANKTTSFYWPISCSVDWIKKSEIEKVDKFSRPQYELDAWGVSDNSMVPNTAIFHPRLNAVCGIVQNGSYNECGVFTCDYDEQDPQNENYFDYPNGWEKGQTYPGGVIEVTNTDKHFGYECVHVKNSLGPWKSLTINPSKSYIFSAWIKPITEGVPIMAYPSYHNGQQVTTAFTLTGMTKNQWNFVQKTITSGSLQSAGLQNGDVMQIWIGNNANAPTVSTGGESMAEFYIDDIRFYPSDAHVTTYYYDQALGVPITFVDENENTKKFAYDAFGRLTTVMNNAGQIVKTAVYSSGSPSTATGTIRILTPTNNATLVRSIGNTLPITWITYGTVGNVSLKYSTDEKLTWTSIATDQPNNGAYAWVLPSSLGSSTSVWIRIEESTKGNLVFDESSVSFKILNTVSNNRSFVVQFIMDLLGNLGGN